MKRTGKRIFLLFVMLMMVCAMHMTAFASEELPDLNRAGSISIMMKNTETGEIVPGGSLALYQVAEAVEDEGYIFQFTVDFADCGLSLADVESEKLASALVSYAESNGIDKVTRNVETDSSVSFTGLKAGLYLIVQQTSAAGYNAVSPFLVSIPMRQAKGNGWVYDVDASPKLELIQDSLPAQAHKTTLSLGKKLPQTGQLNWPIPVMAIAGMLIFALGWRLNSTKNDIKNSMKGKNGYEK